MNENQNSILTINRHRNRRGLIIKNIFDICLTALILITLTGSIAISLKNNEFVRKLRSLNPNYPFPHKSDLYYTFLIIILFLSIKFISESILFHMTIKIMDKKYKTKEMTKIIQKKLARNIIKSIYYTIITIFSYYILYQLDYFPKEFGGNGYISKVFEKGYPYYFYHRKTKYFNLHYLICLSHTLSEFICVIFIYEKQTDFFIVLLHHLCTLSLITFSYITNYSNIGSLVLFLHNASDAVVYISRSILYIYSPSQVKQITSLVLLIDFVYLRIFVLGKIIYIIYLYTDLKCDFISFNLWCYLIFLYFLHGNWTYLLTKTLYNALFKKIFNDSFNFISLVNNNFCKEFNNIDFK